MFLEVMIHTSRFPENDNMLARYLIINIDTVTNRCHSITAMHCVTFPSFNKRQKKSLSFFQTFIVFVDVPTEHVGQNGRNWKISMNKWHKFIRKGTPTCYELSHSFIPLFLQLKTCIMLLAHALALDSFWKMQRYYTDRHFKSCCLYF